MQFHKYTDKKMITAMVNSYHHGKFNYMSGYQQLYTPVQYNQLQLKVNKLLRNTSTTGAEKQNMYQNNIYISQFELLGRMKLKSFANSHRRSQMVAMGKLVWQCYPVDEFNEFMKLVKFPTRTTRIRQQFFQPVVKINGIKIDSKYNNYAPACWYYEFSKLPNEIKNNLGSKIFIHNVKKIYRDRCQHSEIQTRMCLKCGQNTRMYGDPQMVNSMRRTWSQIGIHKINVKMDRFHTLQQMLQEQNGQNYIELFNIPIEEIEIFEEQENEFINRILGNHSKSQT